MNKTTIIAMVASLVRFRENISSFESEVEIGVAEGVESLLSIHEKFHRAINAKITGKNANDERYPVLKQELVNF